MLRTVHFHGRLATRFRRRKIRLDVESVAEAVRGLCVLLPGFAEHVRAHQYAVVASNGRDSLQLTPDALGLHLGGRRDIHITPVGQAAGLETIAIIGLGLLVAASVAAVFLLRPKVPDINSRERKDQSFIFDGPVNVTEQGHCVPVVYGFKVRVGSIVVSAGITTTDVNATAIDQGSPGGGGGGGYVGSTAGVTNSDAGDLWEDLVEIDALKGGKAGGGGMASGESPNTLQSQATLKIVDLVSEGEIGGLVDGLKSSFLDGTPVQNADLSFNFPGYSLEERLGLPDQDPMPGFTDQENGTDVNVEITQGTPVVRTISDPVVDVVRVTLSVPRIFEQDDETGELNPTQAQIAIDHQSDGGGYTEVVSYTFNGKNNSPYQRSFDIRLVGDGPHDIRVRRITPDSEVTTLENSTFWDSYFEIIEAKLIYPDSAVYGVTVDAKQFGSSVPARSYEIDGLVIDIPSNYNPITRAYTGIWDGTFTRAVCNNPAWVLYDIIKHRRYGLGARVPVGSIDKFSLYAVAQYCDGLVPDGLGGTQPRYTINACINSVESAYNVLASIASAFRGYVYWGSGSVTVTQDRPEDPTLLVTPSNAVDGQLRYETVIEKPKLRSVAIVYWNDPEDGFRLTPEIVEDDNLIRRMGWKPGQAVTRFGCTNRAEAHYAARWILDDQKFANKAISYDTADDHGFVAPGRVVSVADPKFTTVRRGGRVKPGSTTATVILDRPVLLVVGQVYTLRVMLPDGTVGMSAVTNGAGTTDTITLAVALAAAPARGSVWAIESDLVANRQFRVRSASADEPPYEIKAVLYDPGAFDRVEQGIDLTPTNFLDLPSGPLTKPAGLAAIEFLLNDGNAVSPAVQFSWESSPDPRILFFQPRYKRPGGEWQKLDDGPALSREIRNAQAGTWGFMVRAVDGFGRTTPWVSGEVELDGQADTLPEVEAPGLVVNDETFTAKLIWLPPASIRPLRYEILFSDTDDIGTAASLGVTEELEWTILLPGYYWVRTRFIRLFSPLPESTLVPAIVFSAGIVPHLTNDSFQVPADAAGNVISYSGASGSFVVMSGTTDVSASFALSTVSGGNPQGLTIGYTAQAYSVTAGLDAGEETATVRIRATGSGTYAGVELDKIFSLSKARIGATGDTGDTGPTGNQMKLAFKRQLPQPATPTGSAPSGWSIGAIPTGTETVWASAGLFDAADNLIGSWSTPTSTGGSGLTFRYEYDSGATYYLFNTVSFNGGFGAGTYVALQDNFSAQPPTGTAEANAYWGVVAAPGEAGTPGDPPSGFTATIGLPSGAAVNLRTEANTAGYTGASDATITFNADSGDVIRGATAGGLGLDTGTWPTGSYTITIILNVNSGAIIDGGGGDGGTAGGGAGGAGGDAIYCRIPLTINVASGGTVRAGGGGGGASNGVIVPPPGQPPNVGDPYNGGSGGGGGAPNGLGGFGEPGADGGTDGSDGNPGTTAGGGSGAGNGGTFATDGSAAGGAGAGGVAGYAVRKNGHTVTVNNSGTVTGTQG